MSLTRRWSQHDCLSRIVLPHAPRQATVRLTFNVRQNMKLKHSLQIASFAIAGGAIGFSFKTWLTHQEPQRYCIEVTGISVIGELSQFQKTELESLRLQAKQLDPKNPIMSIQFLSSNKVKITTGVSEAPLSGGGRFFTLQKKNQYWEIVDSESGYWMS